MTAPAPSPAPSSADDAAADTGPRNSTEQGLSIAGRVGLAGRTGFYLVLTGITIRIALLGGSSHQADANGALGLVDRSLLGQMAIAAVALGFALFGVGRLVGAWRDESVSVARRVLTALQGAFYVLMAYVPVSFLAGNSQTGSQQQQQKTTAHLLHLPAGQELVAAAGVILVVVCLQQIHGALQQDFRDGLDLAAAPSIVRRVAGTAGVVGITARALVFLPVGLFLLISAIQFNPGHSYGTDAELLRLSGSTWGLAVLAAVALGLAVFVVYSAIEARYRKVISAR